MRKFSKIFKDFLRQRGLRLAAGLCHVTNDKELHGM